MDKNGLQGVPGSLVNGLAGGIMYGMTCSIAQNCTAWGFALSTTLAAGAGFIGGPMCAVRAISTVNFSIISGTIIGIATAKKKM